MSNELPMTDTMVEFIEALTFWHTTKVTRLRGIQDEVKEGTGLRLGSASSDIATMSKREAAFFQAGMEAVLVELGKLPFTVNRNDEDDDSVDEFGATS
ncbi:hypothetical protein [Rhodoferax sp.]|uniref:hypothetical protein n=1 Tax=Rhodoferax sp. TaxID=50421 RepID=UPI00284757E3|nr:hypothetical protein [Rhodoferax sp.]MDR3370703.1 hypothetical protein [Rhodoferax sp.]